MIVWPGSSGGGCRAASGYCGFVVKVRLAGVNPGELTVTLIVPGVGSD
jgi:hypothetical protein